MNIQQTLLLNQKLKTISEKDLFSTYARPLTSKLLETMELAKHFYHGEGDYLFYEKDQKIHRVLDMTGGYGANILGHRHPRILAKVQEWNEKGSPSLTQGSIRHEAGKLAKRISDTLHMETGEGPWVTTFSNSGTEAVEAALKHCLIYFGHKLIELEQEIEKEMNLALIKIKRSEGALQARLIRNLRVDLVERITQLKMNEERKSYFTHQINNAHDIDELVSLVREVNKKQLQQRPSFIALEKAYHGKTMGALSLTFNEGFRTAFYLGGEDNKNTTFISQYIDHAELEKMIDNSRQDLIFISETPQGSVTWAKHSFSLLAGAFVEPIQGEAGIVPVNVPFLALLKKYSLQEDFLLVFDEIQSGMYRTGRLAAGTHTDITPDIYTFSKSLGGGVAKIAATTINNRKYIDDFGFLHTSTFSDDDFSSGIALEVLNILQGENSPLEEGLKTADFLSARLEWLRSKYPDIIKDIRGRGMMLAIEFNDIFKEMGFEFKTICDSKMQGYMMASVLLNHENIRMSPSLSNNLTLRIQPSMYFTIIQVEELIHALSNLAEALKNRNVAYFLSSIYPGENVTNEMTDQLKTEITGERPISVFLCHLIDEAHIKKVTKSLKGVQGERLLRKLALPKDLAEFEVYHAQTIVDNNGVEMDVVMLGIPVTSEELKKTFTSRQKYKVVQKVQNAVDFAKELGASTVGLGQFTSIVSGNGLYLNSRGMNLTTGNAFTISLTVQSALRSVEEKNIDLKTATVALIGAAGNIMSVATSLMADHVGKVVMLHHSPIESSLKYQEATKRILNEIAASKADSKVVQIVSKYWQLEKDLLKFLAIPEVKEVFDASADVNQIKDAEVVLCGASASNGFLSLDLFKQNAVVVDVAVPPSIKPEMISKIESERPDLTYHLGGVASIPQGQSLDFIVFPLGHNECYACMAETFALGFSGRKNFLNIGDLSKDIVMEVQEIAKNVGFTLGNTKKKSSL